MAVSIAFKGWFQARFATDSDDFDHPRGRDGWTFAFEGEPDFDRIIRLAYPVAPRSHGPQVGVTVSAVTVNGAAVPGHVLLGAPVEWSGGPKFEGHNRDIAPDGREPVFPFNLKIAAGPVSLGIAEWLTFADLTRPVAKPRFGKGVNFVDAARLLAVLGTADTVAFRKARRKALADDLPNAADPVAKTALQQRIARIDDPNTQMPLSALKFLVPYNFKIPDASRSAADPGNTLGGNLLGQPWLMDWSMGCWDADALCGFLEGSLKIG